MQNGRFKVLRISGARPISHMPDSAFDALRTIRVILGDAKYCKIVPEIDGYLPVAALAAFMDVKYGLSISLDNLIDILSRFGSQYVDLVRPKGLWLVKRQIPSSGAKLVHFPSTCPGTGCGSY